MKFLQSVVIGLTVASAPLALGQSMSIADIIADKGPVSKMTIGDLPEQYRAVKITLTNESVFGSMMLSQFAMQPGSPPGLLDALSSYWTTGEEVNVDGLKFLVAYKVDMALTDLVPGAGGPAPKTISPSLTLNLMRVDHIASITPVPDFKKSNLLLALNFTPAQMPSPVAAAIDAPASAVAVPAQAAPMPAALKTQAISNMKQIALGQLMYCGDYDDYFPYVQNTATTRQLIQPYIRNDQAWKSLNPKGGRILFNMNLAGVFGSSVPNPAEVPMFYDEIAWPEGFRLVAFVDGHVKSVAAKDWPKAEAQIKKKYPRKGKPLPPVKETMF